VGIPLHSYWEEISHGRPGSHFVGLFGEPETTFVLKINLFAHQLK